MDEKFLCSISLQKHFVKEPLVLLSCGHAACKICLPIETKICNKCNNRVDIKDDKNKVEAFYKEFKNNLNALVSDLETKINNKIEKLKSFY
jgi:hypothetical protein